jgi:hypothetical protein
VTPAQADLGSRQKKHPPPQPDRAQQLYAVLAPYLPERLRDLVDSGTVTIGAIGTTMPDIETIAVKGDGHVITFTTGLMQFVYAVSRALAAGINVIERDATQRATLDVEGVAPRIARIYRVWMRYHQWPWRLLPFGRPRLDRFDFPISREAHQLAEDLATRAEAFMLAHELGHVLIDRKMTDVAGENEESRADEVGFRLFLASEHSRMGMAAATWAIRILAGLRRAGFRFSDAYPPPEQRMDRLFGVLRSMNRSDRNVDEMSTIAIANASYLGAAEAQVFGARADAAPDERQIRITLVAILEELASGRITPSQGRDDFAATSRAVDARTRGRVFDVLIRYYLLEAMAVEGYLRQDMALQMGGMLLQLPTQLPADVAADLQAALDRVPKQM